MAVSTDFQSIFAKYSDEQLEYAIMAALATHPEAKVKDLMSEYGDTEQRKIIECTPPILYTATKLALDIALNTQNTTPLSPPVKALKKQLDKLFIEKKKYDKVVKKGYSDN